MLSELSPEPQPGASGCAQIVPGKVKLFPMKTNETRNTSKSTNKFRMLKF